MDFDVDHVTQMITAVALAYIAYQNHTGNKQSREGDEKIVKEARENGVKIEDLHNAVNGVLATTKADTLVASELRLKESTAAARAEGVIEGKASQ